MGVGMLRNELLSLPGVEQAEFDGDSAAPAGVRIRLSPGVDPAVIGEEIRRVLSVHGLRQEIDDAVRAPVAGRSSLDERETEQSLEPEVEIRDGKPYTSDLAIGLGAGLESVSVAEGHGGVAVTAVGRSVETTVRASGVSGPAVDQAVVSAVADLAGAAAPPLICSLDERELAGTPVVTIVIEANGQRLVGSAVVEGGRAYAVGRAVWAALSSRWES